MEEREVLILCVGVMALGFALLRRDQLRQLAGHRLLLGAIVAMVVGLVITCVEGYTTDAAARALNIVEHLARALHTALLLAFVFRLARGGWRT